MTLRHPIVALATAGLCLAALFVYQPARAVVPGANGKIVFTSDRTGASPGSGNYDDFEIWSMNADGTGLIRLTDRPGEDREPVWSPDGTKIAFVSYCRDALKCSGSAGVVGSSSDIFVMNADGTGITNLTRAGGFDDEPAWSPDGTKIAWRSNRTSDKDAEVFVMNADGTNQVQLTHRAGVDDEPAWSPDGTKLAIRVCSPSCSVFVMNADGSGARELPESFDDPAWTPDGSKIAFRASGDGLPGQQKPPDIHVVNAADGTGKTNLTHDTDSNVDPAFSPDGTKMAYVRQPAVQSAERTGFGDIWVLDVANPGVQTNLTSTPDAFDGDPDWQTVSGSSTTTTSMPTTAPPGNGTTTTTTTAPPAGKARSGYWMVGADGRVYNFGEAAHRGDAVIAPGAEAVDLEPTPTGNGYWVVDSAGRVFAMGDAKFLGIASPTALEAGERVTSLSSTKTGNGYWIFTTKGRVLPFGDATHHGDMAATRLNGPVLDSIPTASGKGYYMVASDGGIFSFGDAKFHGSMGDKKLNAPVQSLVPDGDGIGYWLVASDGGIFAFDAPFRGSMGSVKLNKPVTGMVRFGNGYLMVGEDGGIFNFSDKPFHGSLGNTPPARPIVSVAALG